MATDRSLDFALDHCCMRQQKLSIKDIFEEVCLRCGTYYTGNLDQIISQRRAHVCDPRKRRKIPRWALVGRKRDRSQS